MEKLRSYAQSIPITFESWILSLAGIVVIRIFFEQFSSFIAGRFPVIEMITILHYGMFYLSTTVVFMIILMIFAKTSLREASVISIIGLFAIWIAPIADLITGGVGGHVMSYLFLPGKELFFQYITFFSTGHLNAGVTLGMRITGFFLATFCFSYVYMATKNILKSIGAVVLFYSFVFFLGSLPSFIVLFVPQQGSVLNTIIQSITSSQVINNIHPSFSATYIGLVDFAFNKIMLGADTIITILATILLFFIHAKEKLVAIIKNSRPERMLHFFLLFILGLTLAKTGLSQNWIDVQSYILTVIAFIGAGMFSICQNDIHDENIDIISNINRPLISKTLSKSNLEMASKIFLIFSVISAHAASHYALFFVSLFVFIYFIYSNPPLRLKRFIILNSFLLSLACLAVIMAGFFLVSSNKEILAFPFSLVLAIVIFFSTILNFKDIKDIKGDKEAGIKTLPVWLGAKKSKKLIGLVFCFFFFVIPIYFGLPSIFVPAVVASILLWYFINKEEYKELPVRLVYLAYLILVIGFIFFK
jgi:4-hydroxybenzoate polyprenyltransferase